MRLSKIKLAGFKSFVDPTTIHFPSNLIGIVGPNGCGKSNIIDAVRWVMGESSAKQLRGDSMADVIFNGSTARKPIGQASIELVFDNSAGTLGGQYAQYAEIAIKRMVTRDGQSQYFLNTTRCRRKDITDIFLGTGLGPRSYAIIEQGMISRLIESKPDELRVFIEEAAGISKYKERRRETENRIRHSRDNMSRLNDLRDELQKRLETLQRQSKAAERYKELKETARLLNAQLLALRWQELHQSSSEHAQHITKLETALEAKLAELRQNESQMEGLREEQIEANDHFNQIQGEYYSVGAELVRLEQAIQHAKDTRQQQERELADTEEAWRDARQHVDNDNIKIKELEQQTAVDEVALRDKQKSEEVSRQRLSESEAQMQVWQQEWDEFNQSAADQVRHAEVERARIEHLDQHVLQLKQRELRLQGELQTMEDHKLDAEVVAVADDLDRIERRLQELTSRNAEQTESISNNKNKIKLLSVDLKEKQEVLQKVRERFASLEALQHEALGKNEAQMTGWLSEKGLADKSRLAQKINVASGWEHAVETVLGFHLEAICVEDLGTISADVASIPAGSFSAFDTSPSLTVAAIGEEDALLISKVDAPWSLQSLMSSVYLAEDLNDALARKAQLAPNESLITPDGIWVGLNWLRISTATHEEGGVLAREQLLKKLKVELEECRESVNQLEDLLEETRVSLQSMEEVRDACYTERNSVARQQGELQAQLSSKQTRLDAIRSRQKRLQEELAEQREQCEKDEAEMQQARRRLTEALTATEGHDEQRSNLIERRDTYRLHLEETRKQARADQDATHEIALRYETMRSQLNAIHENLVRTEQQLQHLDRRREELYSALSSGDEPISTMAENLEAQLSKRLDVEAQLAEARQSVESLDHRLRELNQRRHEVEQTLQESRDELDKQRMVWQESSVRSQTLLEQINEASYKVESLLEEMPEGATPDQWQQDVEKVDRSLQRLGAINLAAIDEFTEQTERKQYLDAQYDDLTDALETLENAIQKIDKETRSRFKDTFDKINAGLQEKFPLLFGGGHAYLELTGEDLLDTGVTVMARPPGKRNSTIHLLSGGEKALTAVAMVFSIFELNPAPFCMLDEVDAPLDDANVTRYCKLVKAMSERVQFIFITHNKVTMEMANQLSGVTMNEPGVSRLVAVDVDEAYEMAVA